MAESNFNSSFSLAIAQALYNSTEQFPVDFDDAWRWLEYSRKDNAKANFMKCGFVENVDFRLLKVKETRQDGSFSHYVEKISLTCECLKQWGMMAGTSKGKEVRMYFLDCERIAKEATSKASSTSAQSLSHEAAILAEIVGRIAGCQPATIAQLAVNAAVAVNPALTPARDPLKVAIAVTDTEEDALLNVTQIGKMLNGMHPVEVNERLIEAGLQYRTDDKKTPYRPTDSGKKYGQMVPSVAKFKNQTVYQLRWRPTVADVIAKSLKV